MGNTYPVTFGNRVLYACADCDGILGERPFMICTACAGRRAELARKRAIDIGSDCPHDAASVFHDTTVAQARAEVKHTTPQKCAI